MARFTPQSMQVLYNNDGRLAQVVFQGMVAFVESQVQLNVAWSMTDQDKADFEAALDAATRRPQATQISFAGDGDRVGQIMQQDVLTGGDLQAIIDRGLAAVRAKEQLEGGPAPKPKSG